MTYALCDATDCVHHDGDDCTLEAANFQYQYENMLACMDYEESDERGE